MVWKQKVPFLRIYSMVISTVQSGGKTGVLLLWLEAVTNLLECMCLVWDNVPALRLIYIKSESESDVAPYEFIVNAIECLH